MSTLLHTFGIDGPSDNRGSQLMLRGATLTLLDTFNPEVSNTTKVFKKAGTWFFEGAKFQGSHTNLYMLLTAAKSRGEKSDES